MGVEEVTDQNDGGAGAPARNADKTLVAARMAGTGKAQLSLALYQELEKEILSDGFTRNNVPAIEGRLRSLDLRKDLGSCPFLGIVVVRGVAMLLKFDKRVRDDFQISDARIRRVRKLLALCLRAGPVHLLMVKSARKRGAMPDSLPIGNSGGCQQMK
jgi:hypothetical protein